MSPVKDYEKELLACKDYIDEVIIPLLKVCVKESDQALVAFGYGVFKGEETKDMALEGSTFPFWPERIAFELGCYAGPVARAWLTGMLVDHILPEFKKYGLEILKGVLK